MQLLHQNSQSLRSQILLDASLSTSQLTHAFTQEMRKKFSYQIMEEIISFLGKLKIIQQPLPKGKIMHMSEEKTQSYGFPKLLKHQALHTYASSRQQQADCKTGDLLIPGCKFCTLVVPILLPSINIGKWTWPDFSSYEVRHLTKA